MVTNGNITKIRVFEAFAGYGSQHLALKRLKRDFPNLDFEVVGISEIDKYALQAYNALHPGVKNYGDISKIDWDEVPDFDLFTYSSPCQDFSNAGLQKGGTEGSGTRSSLLWECRRAIVAKKPKYLLLENVAALVSKKFLPLFNKWQEELASYGYSNYAQVLNAKDYGVPQNRERIFLLSIKGDEPYHFPKPFKLEKRLKDVLEPKVDEKYYLSDKTIAMFDAHRDKQQALGRGFGWKPIDGDDIAMGVKTSSNTRADDNFIKEPQGVVIKGRVNNSQDGIVVDADGASPTHTAGHGNCPKIIEPLNPDGGGLCRTIKAQYYKNGRANFKEKGGHGATGVIEYER